MAINVRERAKAQRLRKRKKVNLIVIRNRNGEVVDLIEVSAWTKEERETQKALHRKQGNKAFSEYWPL